MSYIIPKLPLSIDVETKAILNQAIESNRWLAELKGVVKSMPNASILINTLALQEAKDSSAIENIITTYDELYKAEIFSQQFASAGAKEVRTYADALKTNADMMRNCISRQVRFQKLYEIARYQLEILNKQDFLKSIKKTSPDIYLEDGSQNQLPE